MRKKNIINIIMSTVYKWVRINYICINTSVIQNPIFTKTNILHFFAHNNKITHST